MADPTTIHYRWPEGQLVQRLDVRVQTNGRVVAYLQANDSEEARPARQQLRAMLRQKGWGTLSDYRDGTYALRISGLNRAEDILQLLESGGYVQGTPGTNTTVEKPEPSKGLIGFIRDHSLTISGTIATVGNAMSAASGIHRGKGWGQIGQGLSFGVADLPLMLAGGHDDARQLNNLLRELHTHYRRTGIEVPGNASIRAEISDENKSFGTLVKDYMHRYANQIKCSMEVVAAGFTIRAGIEQKSAPKKYVPLIWGSGFLASLLIPERKIDQEKYAQAGGLERAWMAIQSNPLSIGGFLGYSNNVASYMSAARESKQWKDGGKKGTPFHRWDIAIPSVMLGANGTYMISKKSGGNIKTDSMVSDVYIVAAQILNKQPEELREQAIESTAKFLGERPEIQGSRTEVVARLREQMDVQRNSPWFEKTPLPAYVPQPKRGKLLRDTPSDVAHAVAQEGTPVPVVQTKHAQWNGPTTNLAAEPSR